jgi:cytochrome c oxidase cbb3-type subunit I/II
VFTLATLVWGSGGDARGPGDRPPTRAPTVVDRLGPAFDWLRILYEVEWLSFGRLRPLHTNAAIFAFAGNAVFAAIYYSTQRLCKTRMFSDLLSNLHFWGWQLIIVAAALTLPFGITQGKEYAELEWPIDLAIAVVWVGFFGVNFFGTLIKRRERHMYVALWFYIATIVTVAMLHVFNNSGSRWAWSTGSHGRDAEPRARHEELPDLRRRPGRLMQWWYGHNAVAFFLTTPFLGLMYYFLPKAAEPPGLQLPPVDHPLLVAGLHLHLGRPAPPALHRAAGVGLHPGHGLLGHALDALWGGMINGLLTLRGAWHKVTTDPVLKFFVVGVTFYGMSTFEGPMLSRQGRQLAEPLHRLDHRPRPLRRAGLERLHDLRHDVLAAAAALPDQALEPQARLGLHFWIGTVGILLYILPIYAAGITQGLMWRAFDESGRLLATRTSSRPSSSSCRCTGSASWAARSSSSASCSWPSTSS